MSQTVLWREGSKTFDPANIVNGTNASTTVTVTGAVVGQEAIASFDQIVAAGWILSASITSSNTATVTFFNFTGGDVDLGSGTLKVLARAT